MARKQLTRTAFVLFILLALFTCSGGNPEDKEKEEAAQKYIKELDHKDPSVRIRAATEPGKLEYKGAIKPHAGAPYSGSWGFPMVGAAFQT